MLTFANVVRYLLDQELLDESAVVDGDLTVTDRSRRHHNFMVEQSRGPCFLVKEGGQRQGGATVWHEATVYDFFQDLAPPALDDYLPACFGYHHERHILSLELFRGARNLREHHVASGRFSMALAGQVGKALGVLHSSMSDARTRAEFARRLPSQDPWVFASAHRPNLGLLADLSSANLQLIKMVQQIPELCHRLDELCGEFQRDTIIHGDLRWDNCVVTSSSGSAGKDRPKSIKLVDWEFAGLGDPDWDVGSFIADYLSFWIRSIPITGEASLDRHEELARYPLTKMQPAIRSFWRAYATNIDRSPDNVQERLLRATRYVAARLVQTAVETLQYAVEVPPNVVCLLQLSLNMLQRPSDAVRDILGIVWEGPSCLNSFVS